MLQSGSLPRHHYVYVEPNAIGEHGWIQAVWFGLCSYPGRTYGCHLLLECGAVYRNVPLHQLATRITDTQWSPSQAQTWDCYGNEFATHEYKYLAGQRATARLSDKTECPGNYLFTAIPLADGFSAYPEQSKEFYFIALDNGRITAQPTNQVLIQERSFTTQLSWPKFLRRQTAVWSAER